MIAFQNGAQGPLNRLSARQSFYRLLHSSTSIQRISCFYDKIYNFFLNKLYFKSSARSSVSEEYLEHVNGVYFGHKVIHMIDQIFN